MMPLTVANVGFHLRSFENFLKSSKHDVRRSPEEMRREHHRVEMLTANAAVYSAGSLSARAPVPTIGSPFLRRFPILVQVIHGCFSAIRLLEEVHVGRSATAFSRRPAV
jgi:hypothetical protein